MTRVRLAAVFALSRPNPSAAARRQRHASAFRHPPRRPARHV